VCDLLLQVTGQRDGACLLVTLESKQADRLDAALQRLQQLLPSGTVLGVQQDVSSLSGQSGKAGSSVALSPEKGLRDGKQQSQQREQPQEQQLPQ
jgi:hypothetical protein